MNKLTENNTYEVTMAAVSTFDGDCDTLTMSFRVREDMCESDFKEAVRAAVKEFSETPEYNGNPINWSDFWTFVPNSICEKYGFLKCTDAYEFGQVVWEEKLL